MSHAVLDVVNLQTEFPVRGRMVRVVDQVSFSVHAGEVMGLVGESGSGKSMTAYSIFGLVDPPGRVNGGKVIFKGVDLLSQPPSAMRTIRGNRIAMIFQDPMMTLNPVLRIDTQMIETVQAHDQVSRESARARCREALVKVGIAAPDERLSTYPHQMSGGMRQRVAIAIALLHRPDLIIADEPTTALDVTTQGQILAHIQSLCRDWKMALIWITHDLSLISGLADKVAVLYAGKIVESGLVTQVLQSPLHPYTAGLLASIPGRNQRGVRLAQIRGAIPSADNLPSGCAFSPRCDYADHCCEIPPVLLTNHGHQVSCHHSLIASRRFTIEKADAA